jgi:PAS domain-containing protein
MSRTHEDEVRELQDDLYICRQELLACLPTPVRAVIDRDARDRVEGIVMVEDPRLEPKSTAESNYWDAVAAEHLINVAKFEPEISWSPTLRAPCPVCGDLTQAGVGYTEHGLMAHLEGGMGRLQCQVLRQIHKMVMANAKREFGLAEQAAKEAAHRAREERRRTEQTFRIAFRSEPMLLGDANRYCWSPIGRDPLRAEEVPSQEEKLRALGFVAIDEANVRSWVLDRAGSITYGNPFNREGLGFITYLKPLPKTHVGKPVSQEFWLRHHPNKKLRAIGPAAVFAHELAAAEAKVIEEGTKKQAKKKTTMKR